MKKTPLKRSRKPIARRSKKTAALYRNERVLFVKAYLQMNRACVIREKNCFGLAQDVHERTSRSAVGAIVPGEKAREQGQVFFAVCRACHDYLHLHPRWAKEEGWLE